MIAAQDKTFKFMKLYSKTIIRKKTFISENTKRNKNERNVCIEY